MAEPALDARGQDDAGANRINGDAGMGQRARQADRRVVERGLGGGIVGDDQIWAVGDQAADPDDPAQPAACMPGAKRRIRRMALTTLPSWAATHYAGVASRNVGSMPPNAASAISATAEA